MMPDGALDLGFVHGPDPHTELARVRAACPVTAAVGPDGNDVFLVSSYALAREVLTDPRLRIDSANAGPGKWSGLALPAPLAANLLNRDGADHSRLRAIGAELFSKAAADRALPGILETARKTAAGLPSGVFDAVAELAEPVAVATLAGLFGLDAEVWRDRFVDWTHTLLSPDPAAKARVPQVVGELLTLFGDLVRARAAEPAEDLPTAVGSALADGVIDGHELTAVLFSHWLAGAENTINMIGFLLLRVLSDAPLRARLAAADFDDPLWSEVVEEVLRLDGSAMLAIRRFPAEDVTLGGVAIPAGHPVLVGLGAANRDPSRFERPDDLLPGERAGHLAFGAGPHYCPGVALARAEVGAAVFALLEAWPQARLAEDPASVPYRPSTRTRGLARLLVERG